MRRKWLFGFELCLCASFCLTLTACEGTTDFLSNIIEKFPEFYQSQNSIVESLENVSLEDSVEEESVSIDNSLESSDQLIVDDSKDLIMPLETVTILHAFGFYHNITLNKYYEHQGIDFGAEVGAAVLAAKDGVVVSICKDDILRGTEVTVDHGDGVKTVYCFITVDEDLTVGAQVKQSDVIGTVAAATGEEYKDGPHLHFEVREDGKIVDPATHLPYFEFREDVKQ